ncbi:related to RKM4 - ribosomal lysine methyltransferase [Ustilago trichophora]|uniref:Related to RKM4 - ribosomal lysine methyltransferase n=1 Tax=Ustilago trichophora TaxID=86804 RepID=A0A5C3ER88_9BASI|nr:related to RKM4 - ribosomal lysine methyltransferase [Ustilago trichophora]
MTDADARQTTSEVEAAFLRWFRQSGGALDPRCHIQPIPGMGRGMIAKQPIAAGETIFTIPRHILLNLATSTLAQRCTQAEASPSSSTAPSTGSDSGSGSDDALTWKQISKMGWLPLILAMMFERRRAFYLAPSSGSTDGALDDGDVSMENLEASTSTNTSVEQLEGTNGQGAPFRDAPRPFGEQNWGPYFDIMPTQFSTPMFWAQSDLTHLAGTSIADKIARDEAEADYHNKAIPFIRSLPQVFLEGVEDKVKREEELQKWYSLETYHIMGSRILSRSFHVKSRKRGLEGKTVDMDDLDGDDDDDDDDDESEAEVLEDEGEAEEERQAPHVGSGDEADETKDDDEQDQDDDDGDSDSDSDSDDEEEQENVIDISMTPMADMLNARFESDNARLFYKSHVLEMRATKPISTGEQIFNTYADPPNSDLLRRYGHVDEPNGSDVVELDAKLILTAALTHLSSLLSLSDSSAEELKKDLEERLEWACSSLGIDEVFILNYLFTPSGKSPHRAQPEKPTSKELKAAATGGGISEEMIALTRVLCQSREAFEKARSKGKGPSARVEAQEEHTLANAKTVKVFPSQIIMEAIELRLNEYPNGSSVEEEEAKLYGSRKIEMSGENERRALVVRLGEKRVLLDQKRVLNYVLDRIHQTEAAQNVKSKAGKDIKRKAGVNGKAAKDDGRKKQRR